jgi:CheY-like chemotaxis protein
VNGAYRRPILVVDDDEVIVHSIEFLLVEEGYPVVVAFNGREALARAEARLILLDMKMPVMDGWAFAAAYRGLPGPHAPIVVMTAAHDSRAGRRHRRRRLHRQAFRPRSSARHGASPRAPSIDSAAPNSRCVAYRPSGPPASSRLWRNRTK